MISLDRHGGQCLMSKAKNQSVRWSQEALRGIALASHHETSRFRLMLMLMACLDESGGRDTPVVSMAGFLAREDQWLRFAREWRHALDEFSVGYLHMKKYAHSKAPFENWSDKKRELFIRRLIWVIKSNVLASVGAAVSVTDFDDILGREPRGFDDPYFFCFNSCASAVLAYCSKNNISETVSLVCDETDKSRRRIGEYYSAFKRIAAEENRQQLAAVVFADDQVVVPLQAADFLAYELNKYHRGFRTRRSLHALKGLQQGYMFWDRRQLAGFARNLKNAQSPRTT